MTVDTLFRPLKGGSGGGSASDYLKDNFVDTSRPATNNSGLTSSSAINPLGYFFNNSDSPRYGAKLLTFKALNLVEDRTLWIDSKPTYQIEFTESFPQVKCFAYGNIKILDNLTGVSLDVMNVGDGLGATGVMRQVGWLVNTSSDTATASTTLDGVAGSTLTYGSAATDSVSSGLNKFNVLLQNSSAATNDIHTFKIAADQTGVTRISGVLVYFENATNDIEAPPGSTFVDKTLTTTTTATQIALPTLSGRLGAKSLIYKDTTGAVSLSNAEPTDLETIGVGSSGTNLVNVTTGQGASFPIGTMAVGIAGTSFYFGVVTNQSTDTLTMSPTLAFGLSGPLYKYAYAGTTFAIGASLYKVAQVLDPIKCDQVSEPQSFGATNGTLFYSDPQARFRIWGGGLTVDTLDGVPGFKFLGATTGFLQIDGKFAALDFEHVTKGIFHATFAVNAIPVFGLNAGASGIFRKSIMTDSGEGWNSVVITPGASLTQSHVFSKFTLYELNNPGVTVGLLGEFPTHVDRVGRGAVENATLSPLGSYQKYYADHLYLTGAWTRGITSTANGGVFYGGASTNSVMKMQYYGTDFAFLGTAGASMTATLDGASISFAFNAPKSVATLGWHSVVLTYTGGATCVMEGVSVATPTSGPIKSLQNFEAVTEAPQSVYDQAEMPKNAEPGAIWIQRKPNSLNVTPTVWLRLFNYWNQIQFLATTDDPTSLAFYRFQGSNTGAASAPVATGESYNLVSWIAIASAPAARSSVNASDAAFSFSVFSVGGSNDGTAGTAVVYQFNKLAWATVTSITSNRALGALKAAFSGLIQNKGSSNLDPANGQLTCYKYNGTSWSTLTAYATARTYLGAFLMNSILSCLGGMDGAANPATTHETRNAADAVSTSTAFPVVVDSTAVSNSTASLSTVSHAAGNTNTSAAYTWNGTAWSGALVGTYPALGNTSNGQAYLPTRQIHFKNGGSTTGSANTVSTSESYNGVAFTLSTSSANATNRGASGAA